MNVIPPEFWVELRNEQAAEMRWLAILCQLAGLQALIRQDKVHAVGRAKQ